MTEVTLKLPKLVYADDYHEFMILQDKLQDLTSSKRVKVKEIGLGYSPNGMVAYVGVIYTRQNDPEFRKLVKSAPLMGDDD